jgi:hypothetical protein
VTEDEVEDFLARKREADLKIGGATAELDWFHGETLDPYELGIVIPEEMSYIERHYFACAPESDEWVEFGELPDETREVIWRRENAKRGARPTVRDIVDQPKEDRNNA